MKQESIRSTFYKIKKSFLSLSLKKYHTFENRWCNETLRCVRESEKLKPKKLKSILLQIRIISQLTSRAIIDRTR